MNSKNSVRSLLEFSINPTVSSFLTAVSEVELNLKVTDVLMR